MKKSMYAMYGEVAPIAVFGAPNWGGVEVLDIIYGIEDYVVASYNYGSRYCIRKSRIKYTSSGRSYFWKGHRRYYLDQMMAIGR